MKWREEKESGSKRKKPICVRVPLQLVRLADKAVFDGRDSTDASLNVAR